MKTKTKNRPVSKPASRQRIFDAALQEFSTLGFGGARVENIARIAHINKAMIFYYFESKENLYKSVITRALFDIMPQVQKVLLESAAPEDLLEELPRRYFNFFKKNPAVLRIIGLGLLHDPAAISGLVRDIMRAAPFSPQKMIQDTIRSWYEEGKISEPSPIHFVLNIIPLCLFSVLGKPLVEAILDNKAENSDAFFEARIQSITNLLKKGMLT
jgi:TetR/AcrR family transcriptional regulator